MNGFRRVSSGLDGFEALVVLTLATAMCVGLLIVGPLWLVWELAEVRPTVAIAFGAVEALFVGSLTRDLLHRRWSAASRIAGVVWAGCVVYVFFSI